MNKTFNLAASSSTTKKGQSLISTAVAVFEDFLGDGVRFYDMDECLRYIENITLEENQRIFKDSDILDHNATEEEVFDRLKGKFKHIDTCKDWMLKSILDNLNQENLNRLMYKNNLYAFMRNSSICESLVQQIMGNNKLFRDPTKPHKVFKKQLEKLNAIVLEYVLYNYAYVNRVARLVDETRKSVVIVDTDSAMLNLYPWAQFVKKEVMKNIVKINGRTKIGNNVVVSRNRDNEMNEDDMIKRTNIMVYIICEVSDLSMNKFVRDCNVEDDAPGVIKLKNEYLFTNIVNSNSKKHYVSAIKVQEGKYYGTPEMDIKGMEFNKRSYASKDATKFITKLVYDEVLTLDEESTPNVRKIIKKVNGWEQEIKDNILSGSFDHIKVAKVKSESSYKKPMSVGQYKALYVWNNIYPDKAVDEFPTRVYVVKMNIAKRKDYAHLSVDNPEIFAKLEELFADKQIAKGGIKSIGVPLDEQIPEWVFGFMNIEQTILNNVKLVQPILNSLDVRAVFKRKNQSFYSNVINL